MITDEDIAAAADRIARTSDGVLLYRYLQRIALFVPPLEAEDGALRQDQGRRRFALDLMALMAKGIDESDGRNDHSGSGPSQRPIVFRRASAQPVGSARGFRDYARANDPELNRIAADASSGDRGSGA